MSAWSLEQETNETPGAPNRKRELEQYQVGQLKVMCKDAGVKVTGTKEDLIARLCRQPACRRLLLGLGKGINL